MRITRKLRIISNIEDNEQAKHSSLEEIIKNNTLTEIRQNFVKQKQYANFLTKGKIREKKEPFLRNENMIMEIGIS